MGWCGQFLALMRKNRIIKFRLWPATLLEIFLPVAVMLIMVGIRAAITKETHPEELHINPTSAIVPLSQRMNDSIYCNDHICERQNDMYQPTYGVPWDAERVGMDWWKAGKDQKGLFEGAHKIQLVPGNDPTVKQIAAAMRVAFPEYVRTDNTSIIETRFNSEEELNDYVRSTGYALDGYNSAISMAVVFDRIGSAGDHHWSYTIRGNFSFVPENSNTINPGMQTVDRLKTQYMGNAWWCLYDRGHMLMQQFIDDWIIEQQTGKDVDKSIYYQPFATPPFVHDPFADVVAGTLGLFFTIIFNYPVTRLIKGIVEEKQLRIKEGMKMMGLTESALFMSWFATYFIIYFIMAFFITVVTSINVYSQSDQALIFIFFFFFTLASFSFCWLVSVFFNRSRVASSVGSIVFLALFFIYFAVQGRDTSVSAKSLACLSAPVCFGLGTTAITRLESDGSGLNSANSDLLVDNWSYNRTIGMFIVDFFIYLILALYFDRVVPKEWGTQEKWYFCFTLRFWSPKKLDAPSSDRKAMRHMTEGDAASGGAATEMANIPHQPLSESGTPQSENGHNSNSSFFEPVPDALRSELGVSIQHLRKEFNIDGESDPHVAVKDLNLDLYSGQILALLGHNGAGKTTTINMLTGMIPPTSGDAYAYGASIRENMASVRALLGVCPQHNILFDLLTVQEHLELYAALKGVPSDQIAPAVNEMIEQVGLTEKKNDKSAALSGGMQRKLSVGIALLGDSKIVFLDEPTSGMDPYSRRATWDLLQRKKAGRVIILTTHFMDEADQLGDRIAIMASGEMKCCGSSLFLKSRYGVGYTLTLVKAPGFKESAVRRLLDSSIPDYSLLSNIAGEISFRLPFHASPHFADVFDRFDREQRELGITNYGISVTTLEEVFLRVGHDDEGTAEAKLQMRQKLSEAQKQLSHSHLHPVASPIDIADMPTPPPQVVVIHEDGEKETEEKKEDEQDGRIHSTSAVGLDSIGVSAGAGAGGSGATGSNGEPTTINVRASPSHGSGLGGDDGPKKALVRHQSSRFAALRIPGAEVALFFTHFRALLIKRWLNAKRDRKVWTWTFFYPFLVLLIGCGLIQLTAVTSYPSMALNAASLEQGTTNFVPTWVADGATNLFATSAIDGTQFILPTTTSVDANSSRAVVNDYLISTLDPTPQFAYSRYNAIQSNLRTTGSGVKDDNLIIYFNTTAQWAASFGINMYNTQLFAFLTGDPNARIDVNIHPLPMTKNQQTLTNSMTSVIVSIGFAFIPASFIAYAVHESEVKVKHQQLISGVSPLAYWSANYVWDFCNYMVMGLLCLLIFRIWSIPELVDQNAGAAFLAIILYGFAIIPFNYVASFLFTNSTTAQNTMLLFYIFTGALLLIATIVLSLISSTKNIAYYLKFFLRCLPSYSFGEAIANLITRSSPTAWGAPKDIFDFEIMGYPCVYLTCEIFVYAALVLIIEHIKSTPALISMLMGTPTMDAPNQPDEDADVIAEKERITQGDGVDDIIKIQDLRKVYKGRLGGGNKIAVQGLWLGIPEGQCFSLLGINGAGKTTTLKMLTGDVLPTSGTANLAGFDILTQQLEVRSKLGFCPQFDALIDTLTAREHLTLFARIKGVPEDVIPEYVEHIIAKLGLQEGIADKPSKGYSGGNKRKLCVGIALIGNPPIVFLDEPSTGMDPGSRRHMWDLISGTMRNRSVILTTHSMEECEALCHRVGIMVGGRLRCLGSTTHLKSVYGNGFQLDVNVAEDRQAEFKQMLLQRWPSAQVIEAHGHAFKFRVPRVAGGEGAGEGDAAGPSDGKCVTTTIGELFRFMEGIKQQLNIKDYSVSETTLEQIFISFAKQQEEERGAVAGIM